MDDLTTPFVDLFKSAQQDAQSCTKYASLYQMADDMIDANSFSRNSEYVTGLQAFVGRRFKVKGNSVQSTIFSAAFKRCAVLWKRLLEELESRVPSSDALLLFKLRYSQHLCINTFDLASQEVKLSVARGNMWSLTFIVELSTAVLRGNCFVLYGHSSFMHCPL